MNATDCHCVLCRPRPNADPHPKYGYDRNLVPGIQCLLCGKPIGREEYIEDAILARFGQMLFIHKTCAEGANDDASIDKNIRQGEP